MGFVTQIGLDYMHLACLAVICRLLLYWKGPVRPLHVRLGRQRISDLSRHLIQLSPSVPVTFDVLRWKATEFSEFMLYGGPIVLCMILSDHLYNHFMLLFVAMRLLASQQIALENCDYAKVFYGNEI